ncbi:MAG TPA: type II secretion system protein GspJ [Candidatus Binatia bacterium]
MTGARPARSGFTLLEVMMALTIFGLVAVTVYGTFARTLRSKSLAEGQAELTQNGRSAVARMADEIASAYYPRPPLYPATAYASIAPLTIFRSLQGGTEEMPLDAIMFTALSARPAGAAGRDSDQRIINYFFPIGPGRSLRRDAAPSGSGGLDSSGLGSGNRRLDEAEDFFAAFGPRPTPPAGTTPQRLLRREAIMSSRDALDQAVPTSFVENVASLGFRFYNGTDWLETWDSQDTVNYRPLPRAVEIDLALYDLTGDVHHFTTAVDLALADTLPGPRASGSPSAGQSPRPATTPRGGTP